MKLDKSVGFEKKLIILLGDLIIDVIDFKGNLATNACKSDGFAFIFAAVLAGFLAKLVKKLVIVMMLPRIVLAQKILVLVQIIPPLTGFRALQLESEKFVRLKDLTDFQT